MIEEACVFPCHQRIDEKRRDFVERNDHPIGARETAVDFAVDVEDGVALRHRADAFQVERLRPDGVEHEHGGQRRRGQQQEKKNEEPAPAAAASFT
jgi:hypothetical protein